MNRKIRSSLLFVLALSACGGAGAAATGSGAAYAAGARAQALDGRSYDVVLQFPDATTKDDTLHFVNGKFESTACTAFGFAQWSDYSAQPVSDGIPFHVLAQHPAGATMDWSGNVKGDTVSGTIHRSMNGKQDLLTFKGSLRP